MIRYPTNFYKGLAKFTEKMKSMEEVIRRAEQPIQLIPTAEARREEKRRRKDTAGPAWFNMPAAEKTPELEAELRALRLRNIIDPKRHYKGGDQASTSKYVQIGTIIDDPTDFYASKTHTTSRRARQKSLVDSLLRDEESRLYYKSRFNKLQQHSSSGSHKAYQERRNRIRKPWSRTLERGRTRK